MEDIRAIMNKKISIRDYLAFNWVFEKFYEKLMLVCLGMLGFWKILNLLGWIKF